MARFYGTVQGSRGEAYRVGHSTHGLRVTAQSFSGDLVIELFDHEGEDHVRIAARGHGEMTGAPIYTGPINDLRRGTWRKDIFEQYARDFLAAEAGDAG